ncbi:TetR/AcrR family transcriptional regulator [Aeromicrobium sp. CTD01-1L150]|uniref:TetR/AcrR family transcriptional regulator n=1 Tax=Aeromicrobium sp. CTD01-1L150 TaxID=3341830 RepID=UPI0035BF293A
MPDDARGAGTRRRLVEATMTTIRTHGIAKVSARTIATTGGLNQALVFYHFGSVDALVAEACLVSTAERVASFEERLDDVNGLADLVRLAQDLHAQEKQLGNVTILGQVLAGSQTNPALAEVTGKALSLWTERIQQVLTVVLADSPLGEALDPALLAELVSAAFIGIELVEPTRPDEGGSVAALDRLVPLAQALDDLGPLARRAVRSALRPR